MIAPSCSIMPRSSRIAHRSHTRPSASRYAKAVSRVKCPLGISNPRNEPPGQCCCRVPNWTTRSPSATTCDSVQRTGWRSRRAERRNSRVPSMPWGRPGASAWLIMSGAHKTSIRSMSPLPFPRSSISRMTALLCSRIHCEILALRKRSDRRPRVRQNCQWISRQTRRYAIRRDRASKDLRLSAEA